MTLQSCQTPLRKVMCTQHLFGDPSSHGTCLNCMHAWLCVHVSVYQVCLTLSRTQASFSAFSNVRPLSGLDIKQDYPQYIWYLHTFSDNEPNIWVSGLKHGSIKVRDVQVPVHVNDGILEGLWVMHLSFQCSDKASADKGKGNDHPVLVLPLICTGTPS